MPMKSSFASFSLQVKTDWFLRAGDLKKKMMKRAVIAPRGRLCANVSLFVTRKVAQIVSVLDVEAPAPGDVVGKRAAHQWACNACDAIHGSDEACINRPLT